MKQDTNIVVVSVRMDDYGNQHITGTDNIEYKVGEKRSEMHRLATVGANLIFKWDNYMEKDYISEVFVNASAPQAVPQPPASVAQTAPPVPTPQPTAPPPPAPAVTVPAPSQGQQPIGKDEQIARAVAFKGAIDLVVSAIIMPDALEDTAVSFLPFLLALPKAQ